MRKSQVWPAIVLMTAAITGALTPSPFMLGEWESSTIFSTYGVLENHLSFDIAKRGNIGGAGYFPLELSRSILEGFGLPSTLWALRLPVILFGLLGVLLFYVIAKRWFTVWPAVIAASLLAVNPLYNQYQHELIVAAPSLTAFLFFFERLQFLALNPRRWLAWTTLSLAMVLLALLYGPGRILGAIIFLTWIARKVYGLWRVQEKTNLQRYALQLSSSLFLSLALITVIAPQNLRMVGLQFFFPRNAETFVATSSQVSIWGTVTNNLQILVESLVLGGGPHHADSIEFTLSQGRFAVIPLVISPFVLMGLLLALKQLLAASERLTSPYGAVLFLAAMTSLPMLTSTNFYVDIDGTQQLISTLSPYRLMYFLFPAYLAIAILSQFALRRRRSTVLVVLISAGLYMYCAYFLAAGREHFSRNLSEVSQSDRGDSESGVFVSTQDDFPSEWTSHLRQHTEYTLWARHFATRNREELTDQHTVIYAPIHCFPEAPTRTRSLDFYDVNFHSLFLSIYLNQILSSKNVGFIFLPPANGERRTLVEKNGLFGARILQGPDGQIDTIETDLGEGVIRTLNNRPADIILVSTPAELTFLIRHHRDNDIDFDFIDYRDRCP